MMFHTMAEGAIRLIIRIVGMFILIGLTIRLLDVFAFVKVIEIVGNRLLTAIFMWTECVGC